VSYIDVINEKVKSSVQRNMIAILETLQECKALRCHPAEKEKEKEELTFHTFTRDCRNFEKEVIRFLGSVSDGESEPEDVFDFTSVPNSLVDLREYLSYMNEELENLCANSKSLACQLSGEKEQEETGAEARLLPDVISTIKMLLTEQRKLFSNLQENIINCKNSIVKINEMIEDVAVPFFEDDAYPNTAE